MIPYPDISLKSELDNIKGKALKGAFLKGAIACREKGKEAVNPYKAKYTKKGSSTFAMAFRNAWDKGWSAYKKQMNKDRMEEESMSDNLDVYVPFKPAQTLTRKVKIKSVKEFEFKMALDSEDLDQDIQEAVNKNYFDLL